MLPSSSRSFKKNDIIKKSDSSKTFVLSLSLSLCFEKGAEEDDDDDDEGTKIQRRRKKERTFETKMTLVRFFYSSL
jgi:hypothetical protein